MDAEVHGVISNGLSNDLLPTWAKERVREAAAPREGRGGGAPVAGSGDDEIDAILAAIGLEDDDDGKQAQKQKKASTPRQGKKKKGKR